MIAKEKQRLREHMRNKMQKRSASEAATASEQMRAALHSWDRWQNAQTACLFCASFDEPDLLNPWPEKKTLVLPRVEGVFLSLRIVTRREDLARGAFGLWEPNERAPIVKTPLDIILVPGLAFDENGRRLGRGGGFYDRLLASTPGFRVGVCFHDQVVSNVPCEPHDICMNALLTNCGVVPCESQNTP